MLHIDDLLEATYADYQPAVPALAWEGIASKLDQNSKRKGLVWWKAAAIVAVVSGIGALAYQQIQSFNNANTSDTVQNNQDIQKNNANANAESNANAGNGASNTPIIDNDLNAAGNAGISNDKATAPNVSAKPVKQVATKGGAVVNNPEAANPNAAANEHIQTVETQTWNSNAHLISFGIRHNDIGEQPNVDLNQKDKVSLNILPIPTVIGSRTIATFGVGQLVSSTGISVNPEYGNYVHKNFSKRLSEGEGLLASMNFSGTFGYRVQGNNYIFGGMNYYQRKNSLNFNFTDEAPALNAVNNPPLDKFGRYPIKDYLSGGVEVNFKGTNTITNIDFPIGWMAQWNFGKKYTFVPAVSANFGFTSQSSQNTTLDYQFLDVQKVEQNWYRKNYLLMNTSAGVYRNIGMRIKWGLSATANYTVTQMYVPGATIRPRAFTGGLTTQIIWRLD